MKGKLQSLIIAIFFSLILFLGSEWKKIWRVQVHGLQPRRLIYLSKEEYSKILRINKKYRYRGRGIVVTL